MSLKHNFLSTDLIGTKTLKTDERIEFLGQADELSALIMEASHSVRDECLRKEMREIVKTLSAVMTETAGGAGHLDEKHVGLLVEAIERYEKKTGPSKGFVLPGTTPDGARFHVLRTVARRVERSYARVYEKNGGNELVFEYLDRLSTLFYAVARACDEERPD